MTDRDARQVTSNTRLAPRETAEVGGKRQKESDKIRQRDSQELDPRDCLESLRCEKRASCKRVARVLMQANRKRGLCGRRQGRRPGVGGCPFPREEGALPLLLREYHTHFVVVWSTHTHNACLHVLCIVPATFSPFSGMLSATHNQTRMCGVSKESVAMFDCTCLCPLKQPSF